MTTTDATIDAFKEFLRIFYSPDLTLTIKNMRGVAGLADEYGALGHFNHCLKWSDDKLIFHDVCRFYQLSTLMTNTDDFDQVKHTCENYIMGFPLEIFASDVFCHCDQVVLKQMLQLNSMACTEFDVLDACLKWAKHACQRDNVDGNPPENWQSHLGDCFGLIRFGLMDTNEFVAHTVSYRNGLFTTDELAEILFASHSIRNGHHIFCPVCCPIQRIQQFVYFRPKPRAFFSTSCAVLLDEILLKDLHSSANFFQPNVDLKLMLKIFEHEFMSFDDNKMGFQRLVDIRMTQTPKFTNISAVNVLINPEKM